MLSNLHSRTNARSDASILIKVNRAQEEKANEKGRKRGQNKSEIIFSYVATPPPLLVEKIMPIFFQDVHFPFSASTIADFPVSTVRKEESIAGE